MDLSVLCDCRIASSAAAFGHPEIKFGAAPMFTPLQWIVGLGVGEVLGHAVRVHHEIGVVVPLDLVRILGDDHVLEHVPQTRGAHDYWR